MEKVTNNPENLLELRVLALEKEIAFINTILHPNTAVVSHPTIGMILGVVFQ